MGFEECIHWCNQDSAVLRGLRGAASTPPSPSASAAPPVKRRNLLPIEGGGVCAAARPRPPGACSTAPGPAMLSKAGLRSRKQRGHIEGWRWGEKELPPTSSLMKWLPQPRSGQAEAQARGSVWVLRVGGQHGHRYLGHRSLPSWTNWMGAESEQSSQDSDGRSDVGLGRYRWRLNLLCRNTGRRASSLFRTWQKSDRVWMTARVTSRPDGCSHVELDPYG